MPRVKFSSQVFRVFMTIQTTKTKWNNSEHPGSLRDRMISLLRHQIREATFNRQPSRSLPPPISLSWTSSYESSQPNRVYSYFKKRCQKKSKHPISQDPNVVWVVSNRSLLLRKGAQEATTTTPRTTIFTMFISVQAITKLNLGHIDKSEKKTAVEVYVLCTAQNLVISRCCFAEDGKEMYQEL